MHYDPVILRKLQLVELSVLGEIDRVCKKHDIPYFLESGTALGAARHRGFIPWDDDVDIGMLRPDYERFLNIAQEELGSSYVLSDALLNNRHAAMFAKVWKSDTKFYTRETVEAGIPQGVFVDVIPYDVLHRDTKKAQRQIRSCRFWQSMSYLYHAKTITVPHTGLVGSLERIACRIGHVATCLFMSHERICSAFHEAAEAGVADPGNCYMIMACVSGEGVPRDILVPPSPVLFEGKEFPGPQDMNKYLDIMFGADWGELPPLDARKNHTPIEVAFDDVRFNSEG